MIYNVVQLRYSEDNISQSSPPAETTSWTCIFIHVWAADLSLCPPAKTPLAFITLKNMSSLLKRDYVKGRDQRVALSLRALFASAHSSSQYLFNARWGERLHPSVSWLPSPGFKPTVPTGPAAATPCLPGSTLACRCLDPARRSRVWVPVRGKMAVSISASY